MYEPGDHHYRIEVFGKGSESGGRQSRKCRLFYDKISSFDKQAILKIQVEPIVQECEGFGSQVDLP